MLWGFLDRVEDVADHYFCEGVVNVRKQSSRVLCNVLKPVRTLFRHGFGNDLPIAMLISSLPEQFMDTCIKIGEARQPRAQLGEENIELVPHILRPTGLVRL